MKDEFIQLKACQILTTILSAEQGTLQEYKFLPLLQTINNLIQGSSINGRDVGVQALEALLPRPEVRNAVWKMPPLISGLVSILKGSPGPQMTYQVAFCLWLLTFEANVAQEINKKYDIIPILTDAAQSAVKEKVVRVIIATFRNLVSTAPDANLPAMLVAKLLPFVNNLSTRKWSDEDIVEDVQYLKDELTANFRSLTTYDEYASELQSGHLSWSPVHDSDDFWRENAIKLNERDYEQLKVLINLLNNARDPIVLAVAAHDLGQYVKHYDRGKKVIADLGAKTRVMELMGHDDPDVRYQALISVQRLISHPWRA